MKHFLSFVGILFVIMCCQEVKGQPIPNVYTEKFCLNRIYVCPGLAFSDTVIWEHHPLDSSPIGNIDLITIDSVMGVPVGVTISIPDSTLYYSSPLNYSNSGCSLYEWIGGDPRANIVVISGNIAQADTFDIYAHYTYDSYGYWNGGTYIPSSISTGSALLCKIIVGGYVAPFTFTATAATCGQADGSLTAHPPIYPISLHPLPYTYSWSNGQTVDSAYNLSTGIHALSITNEIGCTNSYSAFLGSTGGPVVGIDTIIPMCSNIGTMELQPTGTGPFTYSWINGNTSNIQTVSRGNHYSGLVWDANNCPTLFNIYIPTMNLLTGYYFVNSIKCHGDTNGKLTLNPYYGTAPYSYSWSTGVTGTNIIDNLGPSTYSCTVTDANGCTLTETRTLTDPASLVLTSNVIPATCPGSCDGVLELIPMGGWGSYYLFKNNSPYAQSPLNPVCPGTDLYKVIDYGYCADSAFITVGDNSVIIISTTPECSGLNNGAFCLDYSNEVEYNASAYIPGLGYVPFTNCMSGLNADTYEIYLYPVGPSNIYGCIDYYSALTIDSITSVPASFTYTQNANTLSLVTAGAVGAVSYSWDARSLSGSPTNIPTFSSNNTTSTTCTLPAPDIYQIRLLANYGTDCPGVFTDTIYYGVGISNPLSMQNIYILPNPHSQSFQIQANLLQSGILKYQLFNSLGQKMWESQTTGNPGLNTVEVSNTDWASGIYFLYISLGEEERGVIKIMRE